MSVSLPDLESPQPASIAEAPAPITLRPVLSARCELGLPHLLLTALLGGLFMAANYVGLRPTDLWCHVAYGEWMLQHRALPAEDPFLAFAEGMPVIDAPWLTQIILAKVYSNAGGEALSTLFALTVLASAVLLARAVFLRTRSLPVVFAGLILYIIVAWSRLWTIRPEMFGMLGFTLLLWLLARQEASPRGSFGKRLLVPIAVLPLFALWANLHGSFVCGLAVLACCLLGEAIEVGCRTRELAAVMRSRRVHRWLLITELATLGTLLNPYGIKLLIWTLTFAASPNLRDVLEWQSLSFSGVGATGFGISLFILLAVFRLSRRRVRPAEYLLLGLFATAAALGVRMLGWYAAILVYVLAPYAAEIIARLQQARTRSKPLTQVRNFRYTCACLLLAWICFALSPSSQQLLGGSGRSPRQLYQEDTPLELTEFLAKHPVKGPVFNPQHWGDWLIVSGGGDRKVLLSTMIHHVPQRVWQDALHIGNAGPGWERTLQKYGIETVILDKKHQPLLATVIKRSPNWRVRHDDDRALVATWRETAAVSASE